MRLFERTATAEADIYKRLSFDPEQNTLSEEIIRARQDFENAWQNFQNASDPDLIDCYIYLGNAAWKRYRFLLRQAKLI